mmetsp:Transcript_14685/g.36590  ORF Transcript_14685/g.36590 Transcript_14685/m.36590 type:complete len:229 (+) Transcript_14685:541-1227(+)
MVSERLSQPPAAPPPAAPLLLVLAPAAPTALAADTATGPTTPRLCAAAARASAVVAAGTELRAPEPDTWRCLAARPAPAPAPAAPRPAPVLAPARPAATASAVATGAMLLTATRADSTRRIPRPPAAVPLPEPTDGCVTPPALLLLALELGRVPSGGECERRMVSSEEAGGGARSTSDRSVLTSEPGSEPRPLKATASSCSAPVVRDTRSSSILRMKSGALHAMSVAS